MRTFGALLGRAYETPPRAWVGWLRRRTGLQRSDESRQQALSDPKHTRAQRLFDFLNRYETIIARCAPWQPLGYEGMHVLEIGCGPTFGFGPLAVYRGCETFHAVDPDADHDLMGDPRYHTYLVAVYKDLAGIFGDWISCAEFVKRCRERIVVQACPLNEVETEHPIDLVLSNSCLEHIDGLDANLRHLRQLCRSGARYLHCVDFGNHRSKDRPFADMYKSAPDAYVARWGRGINPLRAPDVLKALRAAGFHAEMVPYYWYAENFDETVAYWWLQQYERDDLFLKVALYFGTAREPASADAAC